MKTYGTAQLRNVALLSHAGAGKTMLAEAMLFDSGAIARFGRVEEGTTTSDHDPDEIKHRISVNNSVLPMEWRDCKINLIDTPGYADFVGEVKSALRVADAAIVVICGASGIEVGTEQVWKHIEDVALPRLIVVNRLDREHSDFAATVEAVRQRFSTHAVPLHLPLGQERDFKGAVDLLTGKAYTTREGTAQEVAVPAGMLADVGRYREALIEAVAETDDSLVNKYLEGEEITEQELRAALNRAVAARQIFPILCTSGVANTNIPLLLDAIVDLLPSPDTAPAQTTADGKPLDGALAAYVFKTIVDPFGKLTLFRVFGGKLKGDSHVYNVTRDHDERISQVLVLRGKHQEAVGELATGDIGAALKLQDTATGDTLASREKPIQLAGVAYPLPAYTRALDAKTRADLDKLSPALARLVQEDPTLQVSRDPRTGQMILSGMGESHLNIAVERLHRKYQVDVVLSDPRIPYRETISIPASERGKFKRQTGGHGQYGDVEMELSPLPRGSGFEFVDNIVGGAIPRNYIPAVQKGVEETLPGRCADRQHGGRRARAHLRWLVPCGGFLGAGVQDGSVHGLQEGHGEGAPNFAGAGDGGGGDGAKPIYWRCDGRPQLAPRPHPGHGAGERRRRRHLGAGPHGRDEFVRDTAAINHAGAGRLHDEYVRIRRGASPYHAGPDGGVLFRWNQGTSLSGGCGGESGTQGKDDHRRRAS